MREGWVANDQQCQDRFCLQQCREGVITWPRMIGGEVFGLIRVSKGDKFTPAAHYQLLKSALLLAQADAIF